MTTAHKITLVTLACVLCISAWIGDVAISEHNNKVRAELSEQNDEKDIRAASATIQSLQKSIADRNSVVKKQQVKTITLIKTVQTPAQIVASLPKVISLPDAPIVQKGTNNIVVSARDSKPLFDMLANCKQDSTSLVTCNENAVDYQKELSEKDVEISSEENIIAQWKQAAKGGTIIHRILSNAKYIVIGAGAGFIASKAIK